MLIGNGMLDGFLNLIELVMLELAICSYFDWLLAADILLKVSFPNMDKFITKITLISYNSFYKTYPLLYSNADRHFAFQILSYSLRSFSQFAQQKNPHDRSIGSICSLINSQVVMVEIIGGSLLLHFLVQHREAKKRTLQFGVIGRVAVLVKVKQSLLVVLLLEGDAHLQRFLVPHEKRQRLIGLDRLI